MTTTGTSEPTSAPLAASGVGSTSSDLAPAPPGRDVLRALACAALVFLCVASPASALLFAPFVPVLVAVRLLRSRVGARAFLLMATAASTIAAVGASFTLAADAWPVAIAAALLLVPALGVVHDRAARRDPLDAPAPADWPEPRFATGLTPTILAWFVATIVTCALAAPIAPDARTLGADAVRDAYGVYTRECAAGGSLEARDSFCEEILLQRDQSVELVRDHGPELLAAFIAVFAFGGAATAHLLVLVRARRVSDRVRPAWRLRDLELHWSFAYVLAAGLVLYMLVGDGGSTAAVLGRSTGVALASLGALAVVTQGIALVAWMFARGRSPIWYRIVLGIFALFVLPVTAMLVFFVGVLDLAIHPRRRALRRERS